MRASFQLTLMTLGLSLAACGPSVRVNVVASPEANLGALHTFRILPVPQARRSRQMQTNDPMLANSITYRSLRDALRDAFLSRGYVESEDSPDFAVAYYASARQKLDVTYWDYGYRWGPGWWHGWGRPGVSVDQYEQGTVIVDVIDPTHKELLWRARGVSALSDDPAEFGQDLRRTAMAIIKKFPEARK